MANESPPTKLISKFTHIFRESAEGEAAFSSAPEESETAPAALNFKQQLERKAHNDAIRVKELQQLRAIIRQNAGLPPAADSQSSALSSRLPITRAAPLVRPALPDLSGPGTTDLSQWWGAPAEPAPKPRSQVAETPKFDEDMDLDFVNMLSNEATPDQFSATEKGPKLELESVHEPVRGQEPEPEPELLFDPVDACLEQAALLYAQGDFSAAAGALSEMLQDSGLSGDAAELLIFSLLDVYRCSGQQESFDALALDYANRYGRSPGEWYCVPDLVASSELEQPKQQNASRTDSPESYWNCPAILDAQALAACVVHNPSSTNICRINWENLQSIESEIAPNFANQIENWQKQAIELHWSRTDVLLGALDICKNTNITAVDAQWWLIHLNLLSLLQQREEFEEIALAYCMRFEYSAPEYKPQTNKILQIQVPKQSEPAGLNHYAKAELRGNILGDAGSTIHSLEATCQSVKYITISCAQLGRVEDSAAEALLIWATKTQAKGCEIRFTHLPRMVLIRMNKLGIQKVAKLTSGAH